MSFLGITWSGLRDDILRAVATATVWGDAGVIAQELGWMSGPLREGANALVVASPGLIRGDALAKALFTEYTYQLTRAAAAYGVELSVNPETLAFIGNELGITIPTEALESDAADLLGSQIAKEMFQPVVDALKNVDLKSEIHGVKAAAAGAGVDIDAAFEHSSLSPAALADRLNIRQDVAALILNELGGVSLYFADEFDPKTGVRTRDPAILAALLKVAQGSGVAFAIGGSNPDAAASLARQLADVQADQASVDYRFDQAAKTLSPNVERPTLAQALTVSSGKLSVASGVLPAPSGVTYMSTPVTSVPAATTMVTPVNAAAPASSTGLIVAGVVVLASVGLVWWASKL